MHEHVATLRRFNRSFTQRIGVLDDSFLGSGRALGPARLLYEIGPGGAGVLELRARLGLDSGYVSRLLRQLESEGLVAVEADPATVVAATRLTESGLAEWHTLDRRSDELAERLVTPLSPRRRDEPAQPWPLQSGSCERRPSTSRSSIRHRTVPFRR